MFIFYQFVDMHEQQGIPFVLGHALDIQAIHGPKTKNDRIDSETIAVLPQGSVGLERLIRKATTASTAARPTTTVP